MTRIWLCLLLLLQAFTLQAAARETLPPPDDPDVRYCIEVPAGGLPDLFQWRADRLPLVAHHRGGAAPGWPENAIETMDNALRYGAGLMEVDIAALRDGTLILMHDDTLDRTTTGRGPVEAANWPDIAGLSLRDNDGAVTSFRIPKLSDALTWAKGRAILELDIKRGVDFARVVAEVRAAKAEDHVVVITYSLAQAKAFSAIAPDLMLSVSLKDTKDILDVLASPVPKDRIIAWTGTRMLSPDHYAQLHRYGWSVILGTLGSSAGAIDRQIARAGDDSLYLPLYAAGVDILATDRFWAVQKQLQAPLLYYFVRHCAMTR